MDRTYRFDEELERPAVHLVRLLVKVEGMYWAVCLFDCVLVLRYTLCKQLSEICHTRNRIAGRKLFLYLAALNRIDPDLFDDLFIKVCFLLEFGKQVSNGSVLCHKELIRFLLQG